MRKPTLAEIEAYRKALREYETYYNKMALGMTNGFTAYRKIEQEVARLAGYLRMLEDMYTDIATYKPKKYTARYRPIREEK